MTVLPDGLLLDERAPARPEAALAEMAALLHSHLIGELTVHPGGDIEAWRTFLVLLGRTPESVRADGGIARVWTTLAGRHIELREIDYTEVLRERSGGDAAVWDRVILNCLHGSAFELDESAIKDLIGLANNSERLSDLMSTVEGKMETAGSVGTKTAAVIRMLRGIVDVVSKNAPERLEPVLQNMATAVGQFSPEMLLGLLDKRREGDDGAQVVQAVVTRMSEGTIARFVSRHVMVAWPPVCGEVGQNDFVFAECRHGSLFAGDVQTRNQNRRRPGRRFGRGHVARQDLPCAEPEHAVAAAEGGDNVARRQAVGGREVFDAPGRRVEPVEAAPRADVDAPVQIFGDDLGAVAGQALRGRIAGKDGPLRFGVVNAHKPTPRRSEPEPTSAV